MSTITATPLNLKDRLKAKERELKAAARAESAASSKARLAKIAAKEQELAAIRNAPIIAKLGALFDANLAKVVRIGDRYHVACLRINATIDRLNGKTGSIRSVASHTAIRGTAKVILADGTELVAPNTNLVMQQVRLLHGKPPIQGAFSAVAEAAKFNLTLLRA